MRATWIQVVVGIAAATIILQSYGVAQRAKRYAPAMAERAALRLGRDSFVVRFQGAPEGREVHEYARAGSGYRYVSSFQLGTSFSRHAEVELDDQLRVTRARSESTIGPRRGISDVTYKNGRALGEAIPMQARTAGRIRVDRALPAGAFDGLALYPVILGQRWRVGAVQTLTLFDTDENTVSRQTIRAVSAETVQAAGAEIPALRLELSTTQLPVTLWVSEATPHRLVRITSANGESILVP